MRELRVESRALSVVFVGERRMRELNRKYRGRPYPTDVLSFSYGRTSVEGRRFLGEIVVAPEVARRGASRSRENPEREVRKLMLHGILHLLGYDHEIDHGEMDRLQERLMRGRAFGAPGRVASTRRIR